MSENIENNEFISSVAHEVRTVLNTIVGLSEDIGGYEDIPEEISEDAEDLISSSKTLFTLIDNILDYITIENNNMKIINAPYNLKELLEETANNNERLIEDKPINFHVNIDENLPYQVIGDKKHIKKIINNVLSNAIKYTDGGDVWFDVDCVNDNDNCNITIRVKDTGCGMKEEELNRLFAKVDRLNIERDSTTKGAGLGLTIVKSLLDMMGGTISVESQYGEGSTFTININQKINLMEETILSKTQRLKLQEINFDDEGYGYKKILIVDDNRLNIKVVRRILEQYDLVIEECYNGQECIDLVNKSNDYDLILMDIMMPNVSGEETLVKLKAIDNFTTPVIALTADAVAGSQEKYESEGFADYIAKPFTKTEIEEKLDKVLKEKELYDEEQYN